MRSLLAGKPFPYLKIAASLARGTFRVDQEIRAECDDQCRRLDNAAVGKAEGRATIAASDDRYVNDREIVTIMSSWS